MVSFPCLNNYINSPPLTPQTTKIHWLRVEGQIPWNRREGQAQAASPTSPHSLYATTFFAWIQSLRVYSENSIWIGLCIWLLPPPLPILWILSFFKIYLKLFMCLSLGKLGISWGQKQNLVCIFSNLWSCLAQGSRHSVNIYGMDWPRFGMSVFILLPVSCVGFY